MTLSSRPENEVLAARSEATVTPYGSQGDGPTARAGGASDGMASLPQARPGSGTVGQIVRPAPPRIQRVRSRRRPSGEPPPLPRSLNRSGKWWLGLSVVVVGAWSVVVLTGTVDVLDVVDTRILQAVSELRSPALTDVMQVAGVLATAPALYALWL